MFKETNSLVQIGWRPFYSQQLTREDFYEGFRARVASNAQHHRWGAFSFEVRHQSVIARAAAGSEPGVQSIAANVGEFS